MKKIGKKARKNTLVQEGKEAFFSEIIKMGQSFIQKPAVLANLRHLFFPKKTGVYSVQKVEEVEKTADWIVDFLEERQIKLHRVGIDGLPGSGKSTLAKALSSRLNMRWISLDYQLIDEAFPFDQDTSIYEHHRLFRTQDLDVFDVIIFIDLPIETIKNQIIERGQGAINTELFDYDLMQEIGRAVFEMAEGEDIRIPETDLHIKSRPERGFSLEENLADRLRAGGFDDTGDLTREEKLFLLTKGEPQKGLFAYNQGGKYARELFDNIARKIINQ